MKSYIVVAVFTLFNCVLANADNSSPLSIPRLPVAHFFENRTVAWFPKVAGGQLVRLGDIDGIVSIQTSNGNHICSGTLVLFDLVLTSAHCVTDPQGIKFDASHFRIVGDDLGILGPANRSRQIATVSRVHIQPRYNPWTAYYDIAILELVTPFNRSATLRFNNVSSQAAKVGQKCRIAGWGSVTQNFTVQLQSIDLEVTDINAANGTAFYNGLIPSGSFAASSINGNNSCIGDPGSALICDNQISGILSFGYGCSRSDFPLVFTNTALNYRWVDGIIRNATTITPAGAGEFHPFTGASSFGANGTNQTNANQTWGNGTGTTTTRRPGSGGGAGSLKYSVSILAVSALQFLLIQYIMKLIN